MSQDNHPNRSNSDRNGTTGSNLLLWAGLIVAAALLVAFVATPYFSREIPYPQLLSLIEVSGRTEPGGELREGQTGYIDVSEGTSANQRLRYSNLQQVIVKDRAVVGVVNVVKLKTAGDGKTLIPDNATFREGVNFRAYIPDSGDAKAKLGQLLGDQNIDYRFDGGPSPWDQQAPWILLFVLGLFLVYFMMRRLLGAGSPMSFGRSRGKLYAQEDLGVTFNDVAGIDEAVEEVREVVDFLRSPEKYQRLGGRIPKGVLLVGPPGTGKTLLAKAIAGEAGVPFFSLSGSDFVEMFVGVGAARVRDMFQQAEAKAPCIIFIDELDALGKSRGNSIVGGHDEREQTLNALLVEMDGFGSNSGVIVMAATNRPETLDSALLRPGRFDRHVLVDRPDIKGREDILKVHVKSVKLDPTVDLKEVAAITPGFVGADLANLVNEAALLAARSERQAVGMKEFNEGVERVTAGLEKKQRIMNEDEKLRVAYHESGHALVAYSLPNTDPVHKVSIIPRGLAALGYTMQRPEGDRFLLTKGELESRIQVLLAGTIAEEIILHDISTGAQNDLERATSIARSMVMEYGMSRLGRVNFRESNRSAFLAIAGGEEGMRTCSEVTLREIDEDADEEADRSRIDRFVGAEADHRGDVARPARRSGDRSGPPSGCRRPHGFVGDRQREEWLSDAGEKGEREC